MTGSPKRLWLALRLRELPLYALKPNISSEQPIAITERRVVTFCNAEARARGVRRGMDSITAQLVSGCQLLSRKPPLESAVLYQLRDQLYRFTPHIGLHESREAPQSGLLLEISTCLKLFSGVKNLCEAVLEHLAQAGHDVRWGVAHTAQGAWLLSFARHDIRGDETPQIFIERLNALPVQVLYDYPEAVDALVKMGFATLGDLAHQIAFSGLASFAKRLGPDFAHMLTELYALEGDFSQTSLFSLPVPTHEPVTHFEESLAFDAPLSLIEHLEPAFEKLLQDLNVFLNRHQLACQHIQWRISDIYRHHDLIDIHCDLPQTSWQLLYDLTLITFANKPIPFEVDTLTLICRDRLPREDRSATLNFNEARKLPEADHELTTMLMKLKTRLGDAALHKVSYRDSLIPEFSHAIIGLAEKCAQHLPAPHRKALRPTWLMPIPQEVTKRNGSLYWQGRLTLIAGPERLTSQWWDNPVARDYYLARRQDNQVLWVYRDLDDNKWYAQGFFS